MNPRRTLPIFPMSRRALPSLISCVVAATCLLPGCGPKKSANPPIEFQDDAATHAESTPPAPSPATAPAATNPPAAAKSRDAAESTADTPPVRFVAYNLLNYLTDERRDGTLRQKPEREKQAIVEVLSTLKPDLLGVCEIGTDEDLGDLQTRLAAHGIHLPHRALGTGEDPVRRLGFLSAFPITSVTPTAGLRYELTLADGSAALTGMERGILDVTVQIRPDYQLRCLGVHLKSKREVTHANQETIRRSEAELLRRHADSILAEDPETNLLVYGDFNDTLHTPAIELVRGDNSRPHAQLEPLSLTDADGQRWTHYWDWQDIYSRFDYCFVNAALKPEIILSESGIAEESQIRRASDHRPTFLTIDPEDQ